MIDRLAAATGLGFYRLIGHGLAPLVRRIIDRRRQRGKEHPERWPERFGVASLPRPAGRLVWLHAASVGESLSALPLIARLRRDRPDLALLVTTGTVTSARLMAERLPDGAFHQFAPVDLPGVAARFLDHWRPDAVLWLESELWPNLLGDVRRRGIPAALVNARMSATSAARWRWARPIGTRILSTFDIVLAQTEDNATRFRDLRARKVLAAGNLKDAADPLPADPATLDALTTAIGGSPVWVAASTHPGEDEQIADAHRRLTAAHPGLITILAPRHPERGRGIADALTGQGASVSLRSAGQQPQPGCVYVADTLGELGLWYRLAPIAFIGGSLIPHGGQNPMEAARLGAAILFGPSMENFTEMVPRLTATGAAERVADAAGLAVAVDRLLTDPAELQRCRAASLAATAADADTVLNAITAELAPILPPVQLS